MYMAGVRGRQQPPNNPSNAGPPPRTPRNHTSPKPLSLSSSGRRIC